MFTRAGYNLRGACRWGFWARVHVIDGRRGGWAQIVEFASGDLAWYSSQGQFLVWGLRVEISSDYGVHHRAPRHACQYSDVRERQLNWWFRRT